MIWWVVSVCVSIVVEFLERNTDYNSVSVFTLLIF